MTRLMPNDPEELNNLTIELREAILVGFTGGAFFPPIAGVAIEIGYERFLEVLRDASAVTDDELFSIYALGHESIHLAQMVTSRWFFEFVRDWARSAILAARFKSTGKLPYAGWDAKVKTEFQTLKTGLSHVASGYTTWEVLETQAVIEGLWGAMPTPSADKVVFAARKFYNAHTKYRHIFDHMVEQFGVEPAVSLGPKLCAIALQYDEPGGVMSDLLRDLEKARGGIDILAKMSATEIVKSRRMDPHTVSRSCRELGAAPRDPGDIVMTVLSRYFDLYEALGQKERLSAMMHPGRLGGYAPAGKPIFLPMYGLFGDGRCIDPQRSKRNMTDFAAWVSIGLQVVDGIAWLSE